MFKRTGALEKYSQALDIRQKRLGNNSAKVAETFYLMGNVFAKQNLHNQAIQFFTEAVDIQKSARGPNSSEVANSQDKLGLSQMEIGKVHDAHASLWDALRIRRKLKDQIGVAESFCSIARLHHSKRENKDALDCFTKSLTIALEEADDDLALQAVAGAVLVSKVVKGQKHEKTAILMQQHGE